MSRTSGAFEHAPRREQPGVGRDQDPRDAELLGEPARVQPRSASERQQDARARVLPALDGDRADRALHVALDHANHAVGRRLDRSGAHVFRQRPQARRERVAGRAAWFRRETPRAAVDRGRRSHR